MGHSIYSIPASMGQEQKAAIYHIYKLHTHRESMERTVYLPTFTIQKSTKLIHRLNIPFVPFVPYWDIYNQKLILRSLIRSPKGVTFFFLLFQNQVIWSDKAIQEFATLLPLVPLEPFNSEEELKEAKFCWEILTPPPPHKKKSVGSPFPRNPSTVGPTGHGPRKNLSIFHIDRNLLGKVRW